MVLDGCVIYLLGSCVGLLRAGGNGSRASLRRRSLSEAAALSCAMALADCFLEPPHWLSIFEEQTGARPRFRLSGAAIPLWARCLGVDSGLLTSRRNAALVWNCRVRTEVYVCRGRHHRSFDDGSLSTDHCIRIERRRIYRSKTGLASSSNRVGAFDAGVSADGLAEALRPLSLSAHGAARAFRCGDCVRRGQGSRQRSFPPSASSADAARSRTWFASSSVKFSPNFLSCSAIAKLWCPSGIPFPS